MQILLLESSAAAKAVLRGRISEGLRQTDIRGLETAECTEDLLGQQSWGTICGIVIGPSYQATSEATVERVRSHFSAGPVALVLDEDTFAQYGPMIARTRDVQVHSMGELTSLVSFLIECEKQQALISSRKNRGVFGVAQFKGGVGATTVAAAFAGCWARHGIKTALIDLDDVTPAMTTWARVGRSKRTAVAEHLALGNVPESRLPDLAAELDGFGGALAVIGQPEAYNEGFHFKANVIDSAPSAAEFMHSLISALKSEYEAVVIDLSRSWGLATFASLQRCQRVLLVVDEDRNSIRRTIESLRRMKKESDDPEEFDLSRWMIVVNAYTGERVPLKEISRLFEEGELFGATPSFITLPYAYSGAGWVDSDKTPYDLAEPACQAAIEQHSYNLLPFRPRQSASDAPQGLFRRLGARLGLW